MNYVNDAKPRDLDQLIELWAAAETMARWAQRVLEELRDLGLARPLDCGSWERSKCRIVGRLREADEMIQHAVAIKSRLPDTMQEHAAAVLAQVNRAREVITAVLDAVRAELLECALQVTSGEVRS